MKNKLPGGFAGEPTTPSHFLGATGQMTQAVLLDWRKVGATGLICPQCIRQFLLGTQHD